MKELPVYAPYRSTYIRKKKINYAYPFFFLVVFCLFLGIFIFANIASSQEIVKSPFSDLTGNYRYETAIHYLNDQGIIKGYPDGTFQPHRSLNRAEQLKIYMLLLNIDPDPDVFHSCFPDVKREWFAPFVCFAKAINVIEGYTDNTFRPAEMVTRAEAFKMLGELMQWKVSETNDKMYFHNIPLEEWYSPYINFAAQNKLIPETHLNNRDKGYSPHQKIKRGEVAELVFRSLALITAEKGESVDIKNDPILQQLKNQHLSKTPYRMTIKKVAIDLPDKVDLPVPYTPQSPFARWDDTHQETCEEASIYMVDRFYQGKAGGLIDPTTADNGLLALVEYQKNKLFGFFKDTTAEETAKLVRSYYGYETQTVYSPTIDEIKQILKAGYPVFVPMAGKMLINPHYNSSAYHMLVIRGYNEKQFIANDPGTKWGDGWEYDFNNVMNAMHDWEPGNVRQSPKVVIVIFPKTEDSL